MSAWAISSLWDSSGDKKAQASEGIGGVQVQVFKSTDSTASGGTLVATVTTSTVSGSVGQWMVTGLAPGYYYARIPASQFSTVSPVGPLAYRLPLVSNGSGDDNTSEDTANENNPATNGVFTQQAVLLSSGAQSTAASAASPESGQGFAMDDIGSAPWLKDANVELTMDLGFKVAPGAPFAGVVKRDLLETGNPAQTNEPLAGVTVQLMADGNGDGQITGAEATASPVASDVTDASGSFVFEQVDPGSYVVVQSVLPGGMATYDVDGGDPTKTAVQFTGQSAASLSFLQCYEPTGVFYDSSTGQIIPGGKLTITGLGQVQVYQDGATGRYCFCASTEGEYTIAITPPTGYTVDASRPALGSAWQGGNGTVVRIGSRESTTNEGFLLNADAAANPWYRVLHLKPGAACPVGNNIPVVSTASDTFAQWQAAHALSGSNAAQDNPDADEHDNLMEYALGLDPENGVQAAARFRLAVNSAGQSVDAILVRPSRGHADLIYRLEGCADPRADAWLMLPLAPAVEPSNDQTDTVRFAAVSEAALFAGASTGYVRLKVLLDADHDGTPEAQAVSRVLVFSKRSLPAAQGTFSMPMLRDAVFTGQVQSVTTGRLLIGGNVKPALEAGETYYIEVISGVAAGQRYELDENATSTGFLATDTSTLPDTLAGERVVVRPHWTLAGLFPANHFRAGAGTTTADRVMFFENGAYQVHWLRADPAGAHWTRDGDATLASTDARILAPGQGVILHPRVSESLILVGELRSSPLAVPLQAGAQLIGAGWPWAQSFSDRGMSTVNGFVAASEAASADRVRLFNGDSAPGASSYTNYFLGVSGWSKEGDASAVDQSVSPLFEPFRAAFIVTTSARPNWMIQQP